MTPQYGPVAANGRALVEYATVLMSWEIINEDGWFGFMALARVQRHLGWSGLEVFAHHVEFDGVRLTLRPVPRPAGGG